MPEPWTGDLVGKMHMNRVTFDDLAKEMNCTKSYVSMILNGARSPASAQDRMYAAYDRVLEKRRKEE